jgi:hypothetical protein
MITNKLKTSRNNFVVPQQLLLGVLVLLAWVLTSAMPVFGHEEGPRCTAAPPNLVGWWPGDGNAKDITPKDHDGKFKGDGTDASNDTDTQFVAGEVSQAFHFDGDADYVEIPHASDLNIPGGKITVDAWINPTTRAQYYPGILNKGDVGPLSKESYALFLDPRGNVGFLVNSTGTPAGRGIVFGSTFLPLNTWTFVAGTYDGKSVNVYVNGTLDGTVPKTGGINGTLDPVLIGKSQRTVDINSYFNGSIDEVELFKRVLTGRTSPTNGGEIGAIYTAGHAGKCKCQEKPAEAEGDVEDSDGHKSNVSMTAKRECDDNGEVDYKDDTGKEMHGKHKSIAMSGNKAIVSGHGNLLDGTPVDYTAVLVGNQPLIGSLFSMTWTTATGEIFQRAGVMTNGGYVVVPQQ